ncbi:MAG: Stealth CR1 domain-containing protein [Muribaculaceae bacterium]|nr:Stealth CR1 domain-containing protein [Muribaculaceae bacterium]
MKSDFPIDFVVVWVDMNDPEWQKDFAKWSGQEKTDSYNTGMERFRDYGFLKYWFRGVEKFTPWVNRIHFVTCGQKPDWLDTSNPKLHLVHHNDIIPASYLPTFNSGVIERYIHRIPGLSEHFVYFNDDFYIIRPTPPQRFFQDGLPCDIAVFQYNPSWSPYYVMLKNNIRIINSRFDKREVLLRDGHKWFTPEYGGKERMNRLLQWYDKFITLRVHHNAQPYLKQSFEEAWSFAEKELNETSKNRFRDKSDHTHELFRTWQICRGNFHPYNTYKDTKMFPLMVKPKQAVRAIRNQEYSLVCINDNKNIRNYAELMQQLQAAFESILPEPSSFEKK